MVRWIHALRLWLWRRQVVALARDCRPCGTGEGDGAAATVAAGIAASGHGGPASYSTGAVA
ncbi:hypothetical protein [Methylobacterium aerolatum]|uniref:Uncharacterized protein n=1 Tax=Methylobacterium aerolatum TaxID=418708 RepID=A0ABU0I3L2_9HYPH|nr:hypothetical protein [Methylobacterium aerolatum]MDQ0449198.1 hypothetical protein [Methylobacterium aerolatum]GJD35385.1 hypothetical protein FMGBMHLM_2295 [Methylobacterium aerolatum]